MSYYIAKKEKIKPEIRKIIKKKGFFLEIQLEKTENDDKLKVIENDVRP